MRRKSIYIRINENVTLSVKKLNPILLSWDFLTQSVWCNVRETQQTHTNRLHSQAINHLIVRESHIKRKFSALQLFLKSSSSNVSFFWFSYRTRESTFEWWREDWKIWKSIARANEMLSFIKRTPGGWKAEESRSTRDKWLLVSRRPRLQVIAVLHLCREEISFKRFEWVILENSVFKVRKWAGETRCTVRSQAKSKLAFISFPASRSSFLSLDYSGWRNWTHRG